MQSEEKVYTNLVQEILARDCLDEEHLLSTVYKGVRLQDALDEVIKAYQTKALTTLVKAINCSCVAKICHPTWDTRKHQPQIGGLHSLRTLDTKISAFLHSQGIYDTSTPYALTRSFEKAEPYTQGYGGKFRNKAHGTRFLHLVEFINETSDAEKYCRVILSYILNALKKEKAVNDAMKAS